jgi:hypothetical protein
MEGMLCGFYHLIVHMGYIIRIFKLEDFCRLRFHFAYLHITVDEEMPN